MKKFLACLLASMVCSSVAMADVYVRGYTRSDGTYVAPHYRSSPNATRNDNWTTRGNVNPYTGEPGTRSPDYGYGSSYGSPRTYGNPPPSYDGIWGSGQQQSRSPYQW